MSPAEKLRREVGTVRPNRRLEFLVETHLAEESHVFQPLEHLAIKVVLEIDLSLETVGETNKNSEIADISNSTHDYFWRVRSRAN